MFILVVVLEQHNGAYAVVHPFDNKIRHKNK